ncbi:MAG: hypothetical protein ACOYJI_07260 [Anaerovoracaceae bacterium]|jgi:hypothetical protein
MVVFKYLLIAALVLPIVLLGLYLLDNLASYIVNSRKKDKK